MKHEDINLNQMKSTLAMWLIFRGFNADAERLANKIIRMEKG